MRPLFLLVPALLALPACTTLGDRAANGCPVGQTCSNETPDGLEFSGPEYGDSWLGDPSVKLVAVGGTETIGAWDHQTGDALAVPYTASFEEDAAMLIGGTDGNQILVASLDVASTDLSLRDSQGALLDRVNVTSHEVTAIGLTQGGPDVDFRRDDGPIALYPGASLRLTVTLSDATGDRLVDDHMFVDLAIPATRATWDSFDLTVPVDGVTVDVQAGEASEAIAVSL